MTPRVLVIGAGSIGLRHLGNLRALGAGVGACDPDASRRVLAAERHGAAVFADLPAALAAGWDAALVCTPTHTHLAVAHCAVEAGLHVFVEKPLAEVTVGIPALLASAARRRRTLMVGHSMRFHPGVVRLRELAAGRLGRILLATVRGGHFLPHWRPGQDYREVYSSRRAEGGGVLLDYLHDFDYLRWMLGEAREVFAVAGRLGTLEIDSDDHATVIVRWWSGAVATLQLDYLRPRRWRACELVGDRAVATWEADGKGPERSRVTLAAGNDAVESVDEWLVEGDEPYRDEIAHFLESLAGGAPVTVPGEEGLHSLRLVEAAALSAQTGAWVPVSTA
jgi:predicted dehydrogenase